MSVDGGVPAYYQRQLEGACNMLQRHGEKGAKSLRGHIVRAHFSPWVLGWYGVARFDLDVAKMAGIPLNWVVKKGYDRLENGWPEEQKVDLESLPDPDKALVFRRLGLPWNEDWCKRMVVKNFRYIEQLGLSPIDWDRLGLVLPGVRDIALDINRDSFDPDFEKANDFDLIMIAETKFIKKINL